VRRFNMLISLPTPLCCRKSYGHVLKHANGIADHLAAESTPISPAQNVHMNGHMNGHAAGSIPAVDIQEHLELGLLNVFVEALFGIPAEEFPGNKDVFRYTLFASRRV
jgi:hypothetical protein